MTRVEIERQALTLPEQDRYELADVLWASLDGPGVSLGSPLPEWQKRLLDDRLAVSVAEEGEDWAQVKAEIWPATR